MIAESVGVRTNNAAIWTAAAHSVLGDLPLCLARVASGDLPVVAAHSARLVDAVHTAERSLVVALEPLVQAEVDSGRLILSDGDDCLSLSETLASLILDELITIDLRDDPACG